jgi:LysM repeat protein
MKTWEWAVLGLGVTVVGGVLLYSKNASATAGLLTAGPLSPDVKAKVNAQVAASADPLFLKTLATGLYNSGANEDALLALKKAADITGTAQSIPGALSLPTLTIVPGTDAAQLLFYKVSAGDIPGAIAKRFGITLSQLANANPESKTRLMAGSIRTGEILALPLGSVDKGVQSRASTTSHRLSPY